MTDIRTYLDLDPLEEALALDGVEKIMLSIDGQVSVQNRNTGETDERHQPIRYRAVTDRELESLFHGTDWSYLGPVDVPSSYRVRDGITSGAVIE